MNVQSAQQSKLMSSSDSQQNVQKEAQQNKYKFEQKYGKRTND